MAARTAVRKIPAERHDAGEGDSGVVQRGTRGVASALPEPEEVSRILQQAYYRPGERPVAPPPKAKPDHYKVVCISLYREDLEHVDGLVRALKARGHTKANRSSVIRFALHSVDVGKMPRSY